ncbi:MAG: hypothetical protein IJV08_03440 [Bacteroidaceae bacterium]|nr:hypothetical protein [Bacteroidaceae bacterium]
MFSESLKQLIEASLVDGVLTDQERNVLVKRALLEGCDPDEVNLLLDAEVQKIRLQKQANAPKVHKCPACGEILPALTGVCPSCGHVVNNNDSKNQELDFLIEQINRGLAQLKTGTAASAPMTISALEEHRRRAMTIYGDNPKVKMLVDEVNQEIKTYKLEQAQRRKEEAEQAQADRKFQLKKAEIEAGSGNPLANKGCQRGCLWSFIAFIVLGVIGMFISNREEEKVDNQYTALVQRLDSLKSEPISVENFDQKIRDLDYVTWIDCTDPVNSYEQKRKDAFEKIYQNYVEQLAIFYNEHEKEVDKYYGHPYFGDDDEE